MAATTNDHKTPEDYTKAKDDNKANGYKSNNKKTAQAGNKVNGNKKKKKKAASRKSDAINAIHRPAGMTLEQWQKALRRQAAAKESFGIQPPYDCDDPFVVMSSKSGRSYRVHYFGPDFPANRCECMDFKTSRLLTDKTNSPLRKANTKKSG